MKISKLIKTYNLTGSLLETVQVDAIKRTIILELDFCYWQQKDYDDNDAETGMAGLIFSDCTKYNISNHTINSDEIVKATAIDDNTIDICVESDITEEYHHIEISAMNVELVRL